MCVCSGMQVCLRGCLTDLVSNSEVGQNVNHSGMEQIEKEWLSNHPNRFFFHCSPAACSSCAAALSQPGSVGGGVCRVEAG